MSEIKIVGTATVRDPTPKEKIIRRLKCFLMHDYGVWHDENNGSFQIRICKRCKLKQIRMV